jgi:putative sterol carrier protein
MAEAKKIRDEAGGSGGASGPAIKMNQVITDVPFGEGTINAHMDTSGGQVQMDEGHIDDAEVTVTIDYDTAKAIFVNGDSQAGMQAFMAGKIKVQGDMTKLMAMQQSGSDPAAAEVQKKIQEITE